MAVAPFAVRSGNEAPERKRSYCGAGPATDGHRRAKAPRSAAPGTKSRLVERFPAPRRSPANSGDFGEQRIANRFIGGRIGIPPFRGMSHRQRSRLRGLRLSATQALVPPNPRAVRRGAPSPRARPRS